MTRPDPRDFENLLTRPDPTHEILKRNGPTRPDPRHFETPLTRPGRVMTREKPCKVPVVPSDVTGTIESSGTVRPALLSDDTGPIEGSVTVQYAL